MLDVSIIIINYNTADVLDRCIQSVLTQQQVNYELIIVDNASTDYSRIIFKRYQDNIKVILNDKNIGFGQANNQGFKLSQGRYVLLLNPDAFFQKPHDLKKLVTFMEARPQMGLAGACLMGLDGKVQKRPSHDYPGEKHIGNPYQHLPGKIAWILGACMMLPHHVYAEVEGFHQDYFLYGEDLDLCIRIRKLGYLIGYCEAVKILHIGNVSERNTYIYDKILKKQKALHLFYQKHYTDSAVKFLVKKDLKRAWLLKLYYQLIFSKRKYKRYQAIYNSSKEFLTR